MLYICEHFDPMIKDYKIVVAENVQELTTKVQAEIKKGWEPLGGLAISTAVDSNTNKPVSLLFQSMSLKHRGMLH